MTNLLSGLIGAVLGAAIGFYSVRYENQLRAKAELRRLLVAQLVFVRSARSEQDKNKRLEDDYEAVYTAYLNLKSLTWSPSKLESAWRGYKGDTEDTMPLFGQQTIEAKGNSEYVLYTEDQLSHENIMQKINHLLKCLEAWDI